MWFWNRVEIYSGFSLKEFSDLRDSLIAKSIKYDYRQVDRNSSSTAPFRQVSFKTLGQTPKFTVQYYLYVHHKDYDQAMFLTSNRHTAAL